MRKWFALVVVVMGCSHVERQGGKQPQNPSPRPDELAVQASIASALLAEDCQTAELAKPAQAPAKMAAPSTMVAPDDPGYPSEASCQQSTMQLRLAGGPKGAPAQIEVVAVKVFRKDGNVFLQNLAARNPQLWSSADSRFLTWDRTLSANQQLDVSFDLGGPDWNKIGNGSRWNTLGVTYRIEVTLRVAGADRKIETTIKSPDLMRDPPVPT